MKKFFQRYSYALLMIGGLILLWCVNPEKGLSAIQTTTMSMKEMLTILPPIFVLLGLLDVWVPRELMIKYMGKGSGIKGIVLAILLGSAAAGPLYGAFPVALVLYKKGASFFNILLFIGAWSTTKIPMVLFEVASMGPAFAFTRLLCSMIGIFVIASLLNKLIPVPEMKAIAENKNQATTFDK